MKEKDKRIGNKFAQGLSTSGRPPLYEYPEKMLERLVEYFEVTETKDLTITGLVLFLGFDGRQSFYDYEKKKEFSYIIKRARSMIENKYESQLTENNATGSIFALKNMGWKDSQQIDHTSQGSAINLSKLSDDALDELNRLAEDNHSPDKG